MQCVIMVTKTGYVWAHICNTIIIFQPGEAFFCPQQTFSLVWDHWYGGQVIVIVVIDAPATVT